MSNLINTLEQLEDALKSDKLSSELRELGEHFVIAMHDWPTQNLESIPQFVDELSDFFGSPTTKKRLKSVSSSGANAWELESAASLTELLNKASAILKTNNVEDTVDQMLLAISR